MDFGVYVSEGKESKESRQTVKFVITAPIAIGTEVTLKGDYLVIMYPNGAYEKVGTLEDEPTKQLPPRASGKAALLLAGKHTGDVGGKLDTGPLEGFNTRFGDVFGMKDTDYGANWSVGTRVICEDRWLGVDVGSAGTIRAVYIHENPQRFTVRFDARADENEEYKFVSVALKHIGKLALADVPF